jgi:hypothetical protein
LKRKVYKALEHVSFQRRKNLLVDCVLMLNARGSEFTF